MVDIDILIQIWKNRVKKMDFVLKWLSRVGSEVGPTKGFCEGDTRNRWRDGQVCPDVDKELWRLGPDGSGDRRKREKREEEKEEKKKDKRVRERERTEGGGETEKRERRRKETERESGRESEARLEWRKGLSPEIGVKKTMNAGGVENGNMN
ncbi:hypothetical protein TNCV_3545331 [Trichonephila clavipes]|uniref:Uncharacterized protein n=1 Tax=Trichonephila clavipes TaxID=2585209 RepID=A0A8X6RC93_TRICX|nr:hypothetical protein TNCV_3545331 [Trichonephila clavipes]